MSNAPRSRIDPAIIAALIGVCGTVMVTLITLFLPRLTASPTPDAPLTPTTALDVPTWTVAPTITNSPEPIPTDTAAPGNPSSTPAPDTQTPEATPTPAPPVIGEDWRNDCISVLWTPDPFVETNVTGGCRSQPIHSLFATSGRLEFVINGRFADTEQYGMFAKLPANGTAKIDIFLTNLQDGEVWLGVLAEPNIDNAQGIIVVIPPGDVKNRSLVMKTMPGQVEYFETQSFPEISAIYNVEFQISSGSVKTVLMRETPIDPLPVGSTEQWLFVGYQVKRGNNRMQAAFLNLSVQGQ